MCLLPLSSGRVRVICGGGSSGLVRASLFRRLSLSLFGFGWSVSLLEEQLVGEVRGGHTSPPFSGARCALRLQLVGAGPYASHSGSSDWAYAHEPGLAGRPYRSFIPAAPSTCRSADIVPGSRSFRPGSSVFNPGALRRLPRIPLIVESGSALLAGWLCRRRERAVIGPSGAGSVAIGGLKVSPTCGN